MYSPSAMSCWSLRLAGRPNPAAMLCPLVGEGGETWWCSWEYGREESGGRGQGRDYEGSPYYSRESVSFLFKAYNS